MQCKKEVSNAKERYMDIPLLSNGASAAAVRHDSPRTNVCNYILMLGRQVWYVSKSHSIQHSSFQIR